jgi:hypothetical protein
VQAGAQRLWVGRGGAGRLAWRNLIIIIILARARAVHSSGGWTHVRVPCHAHSLASATCCPQPLSTEFSTQLTPSPADQAGRPLADSAVSPSHAEGKSQTQRACRRSRAQVSTPRLATVGAADDDHESSFVRLRRYLAAVHRPIQARAALPMTLTAMMGSRVAVSAAAASSAEQKKCATAEELGHSSALTPT